jgi:hypothetical protein
MIQINHHYVQFYVICGNGLGFRIEGFGLPHLFYVQSHPTIVCKL